VSDLGGEFAMIAVIGPGDRKLFQTRVVAFDVVQPRGVGGREDQSDAIGLRPFLDYLVVVGRKVVLDDIQPLLHGISSSEILEKREMFSPCFAKFVVRQKDVVVEVHSGMEMTNSVESAVGGSSCGGFPHRSPLVSGLGTDLQRTELVETDHPPVGRSPLLHLSVQRDDSFFLRAN